MANPNGRITVIASPLGGLLDPSLQDKEKKKGTNTIMLGCIPKTKFHNFCRPNHYCAKTSYSDETIQSNLWGKHHNIMFHFNAPSQKMNATDVNDNVGPILCSAIE